ncbi:MAG: hypothetical protein ACR2NH_02270 [Solirubrobacteraceae bacterium]
MRRLRVPLLLAAACCLPAAPAVAKSADKAARVTGEAPLVLPGSARAATAGAEAVARELSTGRIEEI